MGIQLIVCDVDGTLIGTDRREPKELEILAEWIDRYRIPFTIASGRIPARIEGLVKKLHLKLPVIGCNGACAVQGDTYLWNDFLPVTHLREAVETADELGMSVVYTDGKMEWAYRKTPWVQDLMDNYGRYDGIWKPSEMEWKSIQMQKVLIAGAERKEDAELVFEKLLPYQEELNLVRYEDGVLDITTKSSDKGKGVKRLAELLHIPARDILAIGDHQNDMGMIRFAGIGAAVGNGTEELKQWADYVCENELAAGVLEAVRAFCLSEESEDES
ncbi:HAD family hydrolase [Clostridium sp. MCC353]|uniref:HAD-IIB family hydrolase n=1 Tax=Clostridium sp. MCC353 TaxID=2592646 RepID=UPI001C00CC6B